MIKLKRGIFQSANSFFAGIVKWLIASDSGKLYGSEDGIYYQRINTSDFGTNNINTIEYLPDLYPSGFLTQYYENAILAGADNGVLAYSHDGLYWTTVDTQMTESISTIAYFPNIYPGEVWVTENSTFGITTIYSVAYGSGIWVAVGASGQLRTSTDAISWTARNSTFGTNTIWSVAYGNGLWIMAGSNGQIRTSPDTINWTTRVAGFGVGAIQALAYGNGLWVASTNLMKVSTNGIAWITVFPSFYPSATALDIVYANGTWVAGANSGEISVSTDAISWETRVSNFGPGRAINGIAYGDGLWAVAGTSGQINNSTDTVTWTTQVSNFGTNTIRSISYGNGIWVAGGYVGQMRSSTDTVTWTTIIWTTRDIQKIEYDGVQWVAGGSQGMILRSPGFENSELYFIGGK